MTPLKAVDQRTYAIAQGPISLGGYSFSGASGTGTQKNHTAVGTISRGGVGPERSIRFLEGKKELILSLFNPDFTTAEKVKEAINRFTGWRACQMPRFGDDPDQGPGRGREQSGGVGLISAIEKLDVTPDTVARVILNEKTGTIVMGGECPDLNGCSSPRQSQYPGSVRI